MRSQRADDWHGASYERLSGPQFRWGERVLDRLALRGDEVVLDAGCGTGRLTELLAERVTGGRVIAVDRSESMLEVARAKLGARFGGRVAFVHADLQTFVADPPVDVIFSTATFHWVLDHALLFRNLSASLRRGGWLEAQCGGGPNLVRLRGRVAALMNLPEFAASFADWREPWTFATSEATEARLQAAGFVDAAASLEPEPTPFPDADAFREFVTEVVLRDHLARLSPEGAEGFLDALLRITATDDPPYVLDYVRLNLRGRRA